MRSRRPRDHRGRAQRDAATSQGTLGPQQTEEAGTAAAGAFGGSVARPHLQGGLVASGTVRQFLSVVWNRPACGCLLSSPRYEHGVTERVLTAPRGQYSTTPVNNGHEAPLPSGRHRKAPRIPTQEVPSRPPSLGRRKAGAMIPRRRGDTGRP